VLYEYKPSISGTFIVQNFASVNLGT